MLRLGVDGMGNSIAIVDWALTADDYFKMAGRRLRASSIQKLNLADFYNGNFYPRFLITNRYVGEDNVPDLLGIATTTFQRSQVRGEVFEIRSVDYYKGKYTDEDKRLYKPWSITLPMIGMIPTIRSNSGSSITWLFPNETIVDPTVDTSGNLIPGRIKRTVGSADSATTTYLLEQPTFSERPF